MRQDERVMQLFGLVNTLLSVDTNSFKRRLHIQLYPVTPLAPNAGLVGWVQESDTLHVLTKQYRDSRQVLLDIEYRLMLQVFTQSIIVRQTVLICGFPDGTGLRESHPPPKGRGLRIRSSEYHWPGSLSSIVA